MSNIEENTTPT